MSRIVLLLAILLVLPESNGFAASAATSSETDVEPRFRLGLSTGLAGYDFGERPVDNAVANGVSLFARAIHLDILTLPMPHLEFRIANGIYAGANVGLAAWGVGWNSLDHFIWITAMEYGVRVTRYFEDAEGREYWIGAGAGITQVAETRRATRNNSFVILRGGADYWDVRHAQFGPTISGAFIHEPDPRQNGPYDMRGPYNHVQLVVGIQASFDLGY